MYRRSIHSKILVIVISVLAIGVLVASYRAFKSEEKRLLEEKISTSRLLSRTVLSAIYVDMIEGRADMARRLMDILRTENGVERVQIIRANGREEAFRDTRTIEAVREKTGNIRPEWLEDRQQYDGVIADGVNDKSFKEALARFKKNWSAEPVYYLEDGGRVFTYVQPIAERPDCIACHYKSGARGVLMVSFSLDTMYAMLVKSRNQWILTGIIAVIIGGGLVSVLIRRIVTGPVRKTVEVIEEVTRGGGGLSRTRRAEVASDDEIGALAKAFNTMLDILERREAENSLLLSKIEKSRNEWVTTFDSIQDLISIHDNDFNIIRVNRALADKFGCEPRELIGRKCHILFHNDDSPNKSCVHKKTTGSCTRAGAEIDRVYIEGDFKVTTFPIFGEDGKVIATVHIGRDVTQEKVMEQRLMHSEKMASLGNLVAGIAHELNNPLMGIMGFSQLLMETAGDKKVDDIKDRLDRIFRESIRASKIVQNLLTFARAQKPERTLCSINEILRDTIALRGYSLKTNNIEVAEDLAEGLPGTMVDYYQLQQVFVNIIGNAVDAMVACRKDGRLVLRTVLSADGGKIDIIFTDNGPGVPEDVVKNVFDPFFTTKEVGKGTGLGLSISHGIIGEHGGWIEMKSPAEGGTVVTIELPIVESRGVAEGAELIGDTESSVALSGVRVLVVDDEASIRDALSYILSAKGFEVRTASEGSEALELLKLETFSLILADIKMPGMGGIEMYELIGRDHPEMGQRVVFLTGDVFSEDVKDFLEKTDCNYLTKPFEVSGLLKLLNKVLRETARA